MSHPAERFIGIPYSEDEMDCAEFVCHVRRELYGHDVRLPNGRPRGEEGQIALGELSKAYAVPTDRPVDGDLVMMKRRAGVGHVGLYFRIAGEGWVLHSNETNGESVLQPIRDLHTWGAIVSGYYAWA